jgi:hypothetical protein
MTSKAEYLKYLKGHKASGLKVGDKVRVLRKAKDHEGGWDGGWVDENNESIGKVFTITQDEGLLGFELNDAPDPFPEKLFEGYNYPFFVLEKVKEGSN